MPSDTPNSDPTDTPDTLRGSDDDVVIDLGGRPAPRGERGEGVISTAIAVLIIAFLGVAMWVGFQAIFDDATARTGEQIQQIGR